MDGRVCSFSELYDHVTEGGDATLIVVKSFFGSRGFSGVVRFTDDDGDDCRYWIKYMPSSLFGNSVDHVGQRFYFSRAMLFQYFCKRRSRKVHFEF